MLFSVSLARKLGKVGLISVSLPPGVIDTNLLRYDVDASLQAISKWLLNVKFRWK